MSLYAEYVKEREGKETLEDAHSFITYKVLGEEMYIADLYVRPGKRHAKFVGKINARLEAVAKQKGCKYLTCSIWKNAKNGVACLGPILKSGFTFVKEIGNDLYFAKELK